MDTIDIYTDASLKPLCPKYKHILKYSGVILGENKDYILNGSIKKSTILNYFKIDIDDNKIGINHGELIAIAKSIYQFKKFNFNIRIFSDSLSSLDMIECKLNEKKVPKQYDNIISYIVNIINNIERNGGSVEMFWIKGHNNTIGNKLADKYAKESKVPKIKNPEFTKEENKKLNKKSKYIKAQKAKLFSEKYHSNVNSVSDISFFKKERNDFKNYISEILKK